MTDVQQPETTDNRNRRERRPRERREPRPEAKPGEFGESRVVHVNRVAKVVKGGRRFQFAAIVVIGDKAGRVGLGYGKAREVPLAIQKGTEDAKRNVFHVALAGPTITHAIEGVNGAARVMLKPAAPGTGVIAGGAARIILEEAGIKDVLAKSMGSSNAINVARATINGLQSLCRPDEVAKRRGPEDDFVPRRSLLRAYNERKKSVRWLAGGNHGRKHHHRSPEAFTNRQHAKDPRHHARPGPAQDW